MIFASRKILRRLLICSALAPIALEAAADIPPPARRKTLVETAIRLAEMQAPAVLPEDLVNPFNPVAFGQPDPEELRAIAAARAAADAANAVQAKPLSDGDFLQRVVDRIAPSGTINLGGESFLIFGQKRLRVGDHLTVSYEGQDYTLELTAIDRATFTLRLNRDEITRRIKPGKNP